MILVRRYDGVVCLENRAEWHERRCLRRSKLAVNVP
jgi:hypothetical protein